MRAGFELPDWNRLAGQEDDTLPLLGTALLIARDEYPQLDADLYDTLLQSHAEEMRGTVDAIEPLPLKMQAINRHLFEELGYAGNHDEYYDPRNSYLNEVFERRLGNPISLAMVQMEVARRLGLPLDGVSFPGHFLVRLPVDDGVLVMDPFNRGRPLDEDELRQRARPHLGGEMPDDEALYRILNPASHRAMLTRMLRNLHGVYVDRDDWERAVRCADRILKLAPDNAEALRDRGLGYFKLGHRHGARHDLGRYLQLHPQAPDAGTLRERVVELSAGNAKPN
ncbi:SirB1 family protein [Luteimonas sp. 50]|uniref:SirB1 family protein n=1 Tax=Cognatiluteimonas sedimenti TaxID=2927791 RepID=A0ABT0A3K7_9GAMM|nr:SirB1 family protein [Lysobacter sedimenti]MCJ0825571.1 SirB1 family protein [Lysobacter sedimenti]